MYISMSMLAQLEILRLDDEKYIHFVMVSYNYKNQLPCSSNGAFYVILNFTSNGIWMIDVNFQFTIIVNTNFSPSRKKSLVVLFGCLSKYFLTINVSFSKGLLIHKELIANSMHFEK